MHRGGFTLIELLIVVGIISIVAAMAIPSLLRSRMSANEVATIGACKTLSAAQTDYNNNSAPHTYTGSLANLGTGLGAGGVRFIDPVLANGMKSGYSFLLTQGPSIQGSIWTWSCSAWPLAYHSTGVRSFYVDQTGVIRGGDVGGIPGQESMLTISH